MKPLPAIAAALLAALLVLTPALANAAGTITLTAPGAGASYKGNQGITIAGSVSPAASGLNVGITINNPNGVQVFTFNAATDPTTGAFSTGTEAGSNNQWVTGTYVVTVTAPGYSSAEASFTYVSSTSTSTLTSGILVYTSSPLLANQSADVILVSGSPGTASASYWAPGAATSTSLGAPTLVSSSPFVYWFSVPLSNAADGLYLVQGSVVNATSGLNVAGTGSFTVNSELSSTASVASLGNSLSGISTQISGLSTTLNGISSSLSALSGVPSSLSSLTSTVGNINTAVGGLTTTVGSINTAVGGLTTSLAGITTSLGTLSTSVSSAQSAASSAQTAANAAETAATNASNAVSSTQTYVLAVAVLAAITLVLELAILVRKLS